MDSEVPVRHRWASSLAVVALVVVVLGGALTLGSYLIWHSHQPGPPKFCAGVGLEGPPAASASAALDAWLAATPGQPGPRYWRASGSDSFVNQTFAHGPGHGFQSVQVSRGGVDLTGQPVPAHRWQVSGGCV